MRHHARLNFTGPFMLLDHEFKELDALLMSVDPPPVETNKKEPIQIPQGTQDENFIKETSPGVLEKLNMFFESMTESSGNFYH